MNTHILPPVPPRPPHPMLGELRRLEVRARKGDSSAAQLIREIEKCCREIRERLPPEATKKPCDPSTLTNALALRLLITLKALKDRGRIGGRLGEEIKALPPFTPKTFPKWWHCAWSLTKNENLCNDSMMALMNQIAMRAPAVLKRFEARKRKVIEILRKIGKLAPGLSLKNDQVLDAKFGKQVHACSNEWMKYVEKQTKKAARRVWFAS